MPFPFESGWAEKVRRLTPDEVILRNHPRLIAILGHLKDWNLFPTPGRIAYSIQHNCDVYFYFYRIIRPVNAWDGEAYIGFLAPKKYDNLHGNNCKSLSSRPLCEIELVLSIKEKYGFNPYNGVDHYSGGPYRKAIIPGAGAGETNDVWIVEFEDTWNCREIWLEKTQAIRNVFHQINMGLIE